jgi:NAD(P)H-flavin reductase
VSLGIIITSLLLQAGFILYQNGAFTSPGHPRAYLTCEDDENGETEKALTIRVVLPHPMKVDAGQYVNLWMPTVSLFSWAQTHPFMVTSWSQGKQTTLDLYVKAHRGLSATLHHHARLATQGSASEGAVAKGSVSFSAFVTGTHGFSEPVSRYESVLLIASGSGIAAAIPYLKKLIYGYNTSTCHTRRVHLIWQLQTFGKSAWL